ncbi:homocitrate synthase lys21 [Neonectria punicea]|uniref:homocitrate synthase n=1 Tax=Neonectria punicea TaxID=979145 RepID=A0ABR1HMJ4_9HYPO
MCGTCSGDTAGNAPAAANPTTNNAPPSTSTNNSVYPAQGGPKSSPYQSIQDYLSNVNKFKIIESTLREGEQFANAFFDTETKIKIAKALPVSSPQSYEDCKTICKLGLKAKILTHVRCNMEDAKKAVECGVDGVDLVIGTSSFLREYSHGKSMAIIQETALKVIEYVKSQGVEVRFSSEDSFRSDLVDILHLYKACDKAGVDRVGVADTVGGATPRMVYDLIRTLRGVVSCDIETHFHDDTGCAVANAHSALEAGATHIDTSVLGIGERNGITPLGALMARMIVTAPDYVKSKYNLKSLKSLEELVADAVQINIPFNSPVTGYCAGIHAKAILANPSTYEIIDPHDFGLTRYISINSRITGWNAIKSRVEQLGLSMTDAQVKEVTAKIKQMADIRPLAIDDTDSIIRSYHLDLQEVAQG